MNPPVEKSSGYIYSEGENQPELSDKEKNKKDFS